MLILLPPSEGKSVPRRGGPLVLDKLSFPSLTEPRMQALEALTDLCGKDPSDAAWTLGLGPTQLGDVRRNHGLHTAPTARADSIYTGVLYDALDLTTLSPAARRRATRTLAITSSLFGVLRPGDRIPSYRLSGAVNLPGLGAVSAHWRTVLDPVVSEAAGSGLVVDLRSATYAAFWRPAPELARRVATVRVLREVDTRRTVASHFNKATKGRLVRALLETGAAPSTPAGLAKELTSLGWTVELGGLGKHGRRLDVVVHDL